MRPFDDLTAYCMFIGYGRSGHSLIGSLLDAHPDVAIAHEAHALRIVHKEHPSRARFFRMLMENARAQADQPERRSQTGYSYAVAGQWQGRVRTLRVVGDKAAGKSTRYLASKPNALAELQDFVRVPVRIVHVTRNPYDIVARFSTLPIKRPNVGRMRAAIDRFERLAEATSAVLAKGEFDVLTTRHESFIADPRTELERLCAFVGVSVDGAYLDACARIVWKKAHQTRNDVEWQQGERDEVAALVSRYPFFAGYSFE